MALDANKLKANASLSGLTEEQVTTIVTLSTNDEQVVIGARIGELHGAYDTDVLTVTGLPKNQGEKSYDYVKRVLGEYKAKLSGFETSAADITKLKQEKAELEQKLKDSAGDAVVKQQLTDTMQKLNELQGLYDTEKANFEKEKSEFTNKLHVVNVENQLDSALVGLKFKSTIPDSVKAILIKNAKSELFNSTKPEFMEIGGVQTLIFRDNAGNILNNPANQLKPFTAAELLTKNLAEVIETSSRRSGTGTKPDGTGSSDIVDIASAKNQVAADEIIQKHLLQSGMLKTDPAFAQEQSKLRKEHGVEKLPMR